MDVRTTSFAYPTQVKAVTRDVPLTRLSRQRLRDKSRYVVRVAAPRDYGADGEEKTPSDEESSRQKLEVVTGLLREGYGVGAILTAAAFRGASVVTEILKGVTTGTAAARRRRPKRTSRLRKKREPSFAEQLQQAVAEALMATPMQWNKTQSATQHSMKCESPSQDPSSDISSSSLKRSELSPSTESQKEINLEMDQWMMGYKEALGIPSEEALSSRHIDRLQASTWLHAMDQSYSGSELTPKAMLSEDVELSEMDVVQDPVDVTPTADVDFNQSQEMDLMEHPERVEEVDQNSTADVTGEDVTETTTESEMSAMTPDPLTTDHRSNLEEIDAFIESSDIAQGLEQFDAQAEDTGLKEDTDVEELKNTDVLDDIVDKESLSEIVPVENEVDSPSNEDVILKNNVVETFEKSSMETPPSEKSSTAVNEALDILDKIATFEMEESIDDDDDPQPQTVSVVAQKSKNEEEQEIRRQMQEESKRRLKAMKLQNEARQKRRHDAPVKVERPSSSEPPSYNASTSPPTQQFKGLDYIKSYAKEKQGKQGKQENETDEPSNEMTASFFKPPSILQDANKQQTQTAVGPTRAYSQWNEIDRLKRVREIGTVMWLGKGGDGGGGDDGPGGSGGGRGGNNGKSNNPDDGQWWIQVTAFYDVTVHRVLVGWHVNDDDDGIGVCITDGHFQSTGKTETSKNKE